MKDLREVTGSKVDYLNELGNHFINSCREYVLRELMDDFEEDYEVVLQNFVNAVKDDEQAKVFEEELNIRIQQVNEITPSRYDVLLDSYGYWKVEVVFLKEAKEKGLSLLVAPIKQGN